MLCLVCFIRLISRNINHVLSMYCFYVLAAAARDVAEVQKPRLGRDIGGVERVAYTRIFAGAINKE
jgi:hypothetical protein